MDDAYFNTDCAGMTATDSEDDLYKVMNYWYYNEPSKESDMAIPRNLVAEEVESRIAEEVKEEVLWELPVYPGVTCECPKCGHKIAPTNTEHNLHDSVVMMRDTTHAPEHLFWHCGNCTWEFATRTKDMS